MPADEKAKSGSAGEKTMRWVNTETYYARKEINQEYWRSFKEYAREHMTGKVGTYRFAFKERLQVGDAKGQAERAAYGHWVVEVVDVRDNLALTAHGSRLAGWFWAPENEHVPRELPIELWAAFDKVVDEHGAAICEFATLRKLKHARLWAKSQEGMSAQELMDRSWRPA